MSILQPLSIGLALLQLLQLWVGSSLESPTPDPVVVISVNHTVSVEPDHVSDRQLISNTLYPYLPQGVVATGIAWPPRFSEGQATVSLESASDAALEEFYPHSGLFSIPVTIGDLSRRLVIDTGASNSVFDQRLARQLGWSNQPLPGEMSSFVVGELCPRLSLNLYQLPTLAVGEASVTGMTGLGLPFRTNPTGTVGVLGMDFLTEFDVQINPQARELSLRPPSSPDPNAIPLRGRAGLMIAEVAIGESDRLPFMLDTGASLTVISQELAQRLNLDLNQAQPIDVIGFCGTEQGLYLKLNHLAVGDRHVRDLDVMILDSPVLAGLNVDGILGQNFLSRYQQYWRFGSPNDAGFPATGSLELLP